MGRAVLILEKVSFLYAGGGGLVGFDLEVDQGEWVALMGANGSGKSTVLRLAAGLLSPASGRVRSEGGVYVAQDPEANIVGERVADDVAFGPLQRKLPPDEVAERVAGSLRAVGMEWAAERSLIELSGGEIQRVALASALAIGKPLLLLDEPASHLPAGEARRFFEAVRRAAANRDVSVVYATHSALQAAYAHRVVVLARGRVALEGPPHSVLRSPRLLQGLGIRPDAGEAAAAWCERHGAPVPWPAPRERLVEAVCSFFGT